VLGGAQLGRLLAACTLVAALANCASAQVNISAEARRALKDLCNTPTGVEHCIKALGFLTDDKPDQAKAVNEITGAIANADDKKYVELAPNLLDLLLTVTKEPLDAYNTAGAARLFSDAQMDIDKLVRLLSKDALEEFRKNVADLSAKDSRKALFNLMNAELSAVPDKKDLAAVADTFRACYAIDFDRLFLLVRSVFKPR
jgi:hypothetical protein